MRLWTIHPRYLDSRGLVALWREALLAQAVLRGHTRGYVRHPQLDRLRRQRAPVRCIANYLRVVHAEASRRGYNFDLRKVARGGSVNHIETSRGQLLFEWQHLIEKLRVRNLQWLQNLEIETDLHPHPSFCIIPGDIEDWEKGRE
jgi:hypothetical protein